MTEKFEFRLDNVEKYYICKICKSITDNIYSVNGSILATCRSCANEEKKLNKLIDDEHDNHEKNFKLLLLQKYQSNLDFNKLKCFNLSPGKLVIDS